jgi:LysM repeat protein
MAPLALVVCAVAILVIVSGNSSSSGGSTTKSTATTATTSTTTASRPARKHRKSYRVKPGDVLSQIAVKTGVPLETIQQLNPNVDAQSLHAGQKLKLAP